MPASKFPPGVDSHAHVFSSTALAVKGARYRPAYAARLEAWQALWPAANVERGVVVQPSFFGIDNSEMLAAIAQDPQRLRGVAVVGVEARDAELESLAARGVCGLRLNLKGPADRDAFFAGDWKPVLESAHRAGLHLELFVDRGALPDAAARLEGTAIAVVLDHFGNPGTEGAQVEATFEAAARLAAQRPVWCKLSGPYRLGGADRRALAERWLALLGPQRLVWGSDWPWTMHENAGDYRRLHHDLLRWVPEAAAPAILWDNAARLYGFR